MKRVLGIGLRQWTHQPISQGIDRELHILVSPYICSVPRAVFHIGIKCVPSNNTGRVPCRILAVTVPITMNS